MTNEIKNELQITIRCNEKKIAEMQSKLAENFCYYLPWVGEDLYKFTFITDHYKAIIKELDEHTVEEVITHWVTRFENYISESYNVRERSTGPLFNEVSTIKFIAHMDMIKYLKAISK